MNAFFLFFMVVIVKKIISFATMQCERFLCIENNLSSKEIGSLWLVSGHLSITMIKYRFFLIISFIIDFIYGVVLIFRILPIYSLGI